MFEITLSLFQVRFILLQSGNHFYKTIDVCLISPGPLAFLVFFFSFFHGWDW